MRAALDDLRAERARGATDASPAPAAGSGTASAPTARLAAEVERENDTRDEPATPTTRSAPGSATTPPLAARVTPAPRDGEAPREPATKPYRVASGDTLTKIARQFKTDVATLTKLNNIANPDVIKAGQELKVPA